MKQEPSQKEYNQYVKQVTPTHSLVKNCFHAFWIGGLICVIGQLFFHLFQTNLDLNKEDGGNRKFILITNNESNICKKVTIPRIQKSIEKFDYKEDLELVLSE